MTKQQLRKHLTGLRENVIQKQIALYQTEEEIAIEAKFNAVEFLKRFSYTELIHRKNELEQAITAYTDFFIYGLENLKVEEGLA